MLDSQNSRCTKTLNFKYCLGVDRPSRICAHYLFAIDGLNKHNGKWHFISALYVDNLTELLDAIEQNITVFYHCLKLKINE